MMPRTAALWCALLAMPAVPAAEAPANCLPQARLPLVVQIGDAASRSALLEGGIQTPLALRDAASGHLLWSAAPADAIQIIHDLDAGFAASFAALDLDGDGRHDRLYAGDLAGRVWRFDLRHGEAASAWAAGGVFADFSNTEGRGFLAAPDLSVATAAGTPGWLNIALGTAAPGNAAASNRFYALRDHAYAAIWSQAQYDAHEPLRESTLWQVASGPQAAAVPDAPLPDGSSGWYMHLGSSHVFAPALTVHHRVTLVIASAIPRAGSCEILPRILSLDLRAPSPAAAGADEANHPARAAVPAASRLELVHHASSAQVVCTLHGQPVAGCSLDATPRRTWWRREDAP